MKGLPPWLRARPPSELGQAELERFHYGEWLRARGVERFDESAPLFWDYHRYQQAQIARHFGELADYAREYAAAQGREVLLSGNFFNLFDHYFPLEPKVDLIITEMRNTTYRQPDWYRYVAGFAGDKPVIVVENPYGGVEPGLMDQLGRGRGHDRFRMSLYEAAALGANMSLPYGAWMGSVIEDAFYAPHELCVEIQSFPADHERLFSRRTYAEVAVVYSVRSVSELVARRDSLSDTPVNAPRGGEGPVFDACRALSDARQPYDVVFFPEGELRPDTLTGDDLARYRTIVLPDCHHLTEAQAALLLEQLDRGARLLAIGELATNLDAGRRLREHAGTTIAGTLDAEALPGGPQVRV